MRILFLPNFEVYELGNDNPAIKAPNKIVAGSGYWFFKHVPDVHVDVLDNRAPILLDSISRRLHIELFQGLRAQFIHGEYDAVLSHSYNSGLVFSILRSIRRRTRPHHFVIDVGCLNGNRPNSLTVPIIRAGLSSVSGLIYHSAVNEKLYAHRFPEVNRRFIHFGTDPDLYKPLDTEPSGDFALSIGDVYRDQETLIRAWRHIDFPLIIVGSKRANICEGDRVKFVPRMPIDDLNTMIHNCRFVILPIEAKPYSLGQMTTLQCMSMRKPLVVSDVPGIRDYVEDGVNCLVINNGSEEDIVRAVERLLADEVLCDAIAIRARESVVKRFNEKDMALKIMSFIRDTMAHGE